MISRSVFSKEIEDSENPVLLLLLPKNDHLAQLSLPLLGNETNDRVELAPIKPFDCALQTVSTDKLALRIQGCRSPTSMYHG